MYTMNRVLILATLAAVWISCCADSVGNLSSAGSPESAVLQQPALPEAETGKTQTHICLEYTPLYRYFWFI